MTRPERPSSSRAMAAWTVSLVVHGALAALVFLLPADARPTPTLPPVEIIDRKLPKPPPEEKKEPEPEPKKAEPIETKAPVKVAMTRKLPSPTRPPREPTKDKPSNEPEVPDTGPKIFGTRLEGGVSAAPGQGVAVPKGDSLKVSPAITKKGKEPAKKPTGFKTDYSPGEEAPVAVLTTSAKVTKRVEPEYSERMKELGIEGKVVVELTINAGGKVIGTRVIKSLHAELDKAALAAARQMLFAPALVGKTPVTVKIPYTFTFVLD